MRIRYPPGRSGRLWLVERLVVAQQAAGILHRKHQALRHEESRLAALAEQSGATWAATVRDAEIWQRRAMILGGRSGLRTAATAADPATARLLWRTQMGVELPAEASCELPSTPSIPGTPALSAAAVAYGRALQAGVEHAAVTAARSRVSAELALTQRRLRAVRDRWIPQLHVTIAELEVRLDESEREELTRTRLHGPTVPIGQPSQESR